MDLAVAKRDEMTGDFGIGSFSAHGGFPLVAKRASP
jgi:hypothetical protein